MPTMTLVGHGWYVPYLVCSGKASRGKGSSLLVSTIAQLTGWAEDDETSVPVQPVIMLTHAAMGLKGRPSMD
jgi:hypothetical protein